jgi:hypothetical protein
MNKYPRIGQVTKNRNPRSGAECIICKAVPADLTAIQINWFRGDDEAARVCANCRKEPDALDNILKALRKKETQI